jgi:hypothetical protein
VLYVGESYGREPDLVEVNRLIAEKKRASIVTGPIDESMVAECHRS